MIDVRRADTRFHTKLDWLDSWHSFSFGPHHDPSNRGHGLLLVSNDDRVRAGAGFPPHAHRDMEIVTWVLAGALAHEDSAGHSGVIHPGLVQAMSAGTGVRHSEMNASRSEDVHFVQMWVPPDETGRPPRYDQVDVSAALDGGGLVPVASGQGHDGDIAIGQRAAVLWAARLAPGDAVEVPDDRHVHVFVPVGEVDLEGAGTLAEGDAARLTDAGPLRLTAGAGGAETLIWATA